jgi:uncharacterized protein
MGRTFGALALGLAIAAGCARGPTGTMVRIPPPDPWAARLAEARERKDAYFRGNPASPLLEQDVPSFRGLDYWAPDPRFYFVGTLELYAAPERFELATTSGEVRPCERVGWVSFGLDGHEQRLQVYRLLDQPAEGGGADYFLPFMDGTTGSETYPAGRYVELEGPQGGPYVLDFNTASNPWCAYGAVERYTCPVTPSENRLSGRIEAGERGYRAHASASG